MEKRELTERERRLMEAMEAGVPWWLAKEAVDSVAMSHDERAQTYAVE